MAINSLSAASRGLSGLASGMDTQQMVESMLAGTQNKIDSANQKKAQLTYKQTLYRDLIAKMTSFRQSFFSYTSGSNNLMSPQFFNSMTATTTSNAFKVTASSSASAGKATVNYIKQLAQTAQAKSKETVTGKLAGDFDVTKLDELTKQFDKTIRFKADDGTDVSISVKELVSGQLQSDGSIKIVDSDTPNGALEIEKILKAKLKDVADVSFEGGALNFSAKDGKKLSVMGDAKAMKIFGLSGVRSTDENGKMALSVNASSALPVLNVTVNGIKKAVAFNPINAGGAWTAESFAARMETTMQKAFGTKVKVEGDNSAGTVAFKMVDSAGNEDKTSQITLTGDYDTNGTTLMSAMGIASGKSNKINLGMTLAEANFKEPILGGLQKFSINGVDFSFSSSASIAQVIGEINSSKAGVTISYQSTEDRFVIEAKESGKLAGSPFTMQQTEGNFLTALFGVGRADSLSTNVMKGKGLVEGAEFEAKKEGYTDTKVKLNIDGKDYTFDIKFGEKDKTDYQTFLTKLNAAIEGNAETKGKVFFGYDVTNTKGKLTMTASSGANVSVVDGMTEFGMTAGQTAYAGVAKADTSLELLGLEKLSVTIDGKTIDAEPNDTVEDFRKRLDEAVKDAVGLSSAGVEFDGSTGRYRIFGVDVPMELQIAGDDSKLMGTDEAVEIGQTASVGLGSEREGKNAIASINGVEIERTSNTFTLDGLTFELRSTTPVDPTDSTKYQNVDETIEITRNTDQIYDGITKFVEEYNKLVDTINEQLDAEAKYRDYPPLTEKQKQSMSDREVELWEENAKTGLLRNDRSLETAISGLRDTLYTRPNGGIALYELGIQANTYNGKKDHLTISDPADLKKRIAENPDLVQALFTDTEKGLAQLMDKAIERAVSTSSVKPGILVREAGAAGRVDTSSNIYRELKDLNSRLSSLNTTYNAQYNRYWKQFNSMEQLISQMNQQSGWLTQQFS